MIETFLPILVSIIDSEAFKDVLKSISSVLHSVHNIEGGFDDIKKELDNMRAFLEDVENRKMELTDISSIMNWEKEVRKNAHKVEDLIDEFQILAQSWRSVGGLAGSTLKVLRWGSKSLTAHHLAKNLRKVKAEIKETAGRQRYKHPSSCSTPARYGNSEPAQEFSSPFQGEKLFGIEENKVQLLKWLSLEEKRREVVSICGMAGLGKTTLVREVYNHPDARKSFEYRVWISVSQSYKLADLRRSMDGQLLQLQKKLASHRQLQGTQTVEDNDIQNILSDNRYLIVLDDVWTLEAITGLLPYIPSNNFGSRIIFTTRDKNIANSVVSNQVLNLELMKEQEARSLFFNYTFRGGSWPFELEYWAEEIIKKCQGLPIALVAIAHVMFLKGTSVVEWKKTSKCLDWELSNNKMLEGMSRVLMFSYNNLPNHCLKRCFLYCSLLPEDHLIKTNWLVKLLVAEGLIEQQSNKRMEDIAEEYIFQLCNNSLLQVVKKDEYGRPRSFRVHDLMRELALKASKGENLCLKSSDELPTKNHEYCRRVSVLGKVDGSITPNEVISSLRTLLVLTRDLSCIQKIASSLKLLRVLELRGSQIVTVPGDVFQLYNLRYLGLRETNVSEIPATVKNLYSLQTLDLWKTAVKELPREILKLKYLRHLFKVDINADKLKYHNYADGMLRGKEALSNIWELRHLQSLRTIIANGDLVSNIGNLTQLRSFGITMLDERHGYGLCNSLSRMNDLLRLSIKAKKMHILRLENLSPPPPLLQKLILNGLLKRVPTWFSSLRSLRKLYIFGSQLAKEDPVPALQELPNLVVLALDDAYGGRLLRFESTKFQKLEILNLLNMGGLQSLRIEKGAVPNLQQLHLDHLENLKFVEGIEHLTQCKRSIRACPLLKLVN